MTESMKDVFAGLGIGSRKKVLFICNHNAGRSQMAEAILNARYSGKYRAYSAGLSPSASVNENTIDVLKEIGIDISNNRTKSVDEFIGERFDIVVITCDCDSFERIPPAKKMIDKRFADPYLFKGNKEELMKGFRGVRDEISEWIDDAFGEGFF